MAIELHNITKHYRVGVEQIRALDGVSLRVNDNEYVAVMGTSGSGKSTLMNILGCLDRPTSGAYVLDGILTTRMGASQLARVRNERIGFVFQSFELMPRLNALKNVELPLIYSRAGWWNRSKRAKASLETVGLADRMKHRPNQLSGGQKQRVAIARALVANPSILLADEPTGNLDSRTSEEILALFDDLHKQGQTIIMVTHEPDVARHAKRIIRMKDGRVLSDLSSEQDTHSQSHGGIMSGLLRAPVALLVLFYQSAILALAQIWANKMRSLLTTLGIVIGVTSVSTIVGALSGLQKTVINRLESFGTNNMFIFPDRPDTGNKRRLPNNAIFFKPTDFEGILEHCPSLRTIGRSTFNRQPAQYQNHTQEGVQLAGVEPTWHQIEKRPLVQGRPFSDLDNELGRPVCLINTTLRDKLQLPLECVGSVIKVGTSRMLIIGVVEARPANLFEGGNNSDCECFMPFRVLYKSQASTMNGNLPFMMAQGMSKSPEVSEEAKAEITFFLRQKRHLKVGEPNTFQVRYVGEFIDQFKQITTAITLVAAGIVGISLVVGGVGIMNIMLVSVSERTREIGLRKAVGARPSAILLQFLVEAVFLCLCGGIMGLVFAQGLTVLMAKLFEQYLKDAYIPGWAIVLSFGFCAMVGLMFGMFPAIKAARLDPIEALRHE